MPAALLPGKWLQGGSGFTLHNFPAWAPQDQSSQEVSRFWRLLIPSLGKNNAISSLLCLGIWENCKTLLMRGFTHAPDASLPQSLQTSLLRFDVLQLATMEMFRHFPTPPILISPGNQFVFQTPLKIKVTPMTSCTLLFLVLWRVRNTSKKLIVVLVFYLWIK